MSGVGGLKRFAVTVALLAAVGPPVLAVGQTDPAVDPALASLTDQQLVDARQAVMRQNGRTLRGAAALSGDGAVAAATALLQNFTNFPALFREGSITANSEALPRIWAPGSQFGDFTGEALLVARMMLRGASSSDSSLYLTAVEAMKHTCDECHKVFRKE